MAKLRDESHRQLFLNRVKEIMFDNHNDLWGSFQGVRKDCDEVCRYKKCNVNTWWWNSGDHEIQEKKRIM